MRPQEKIRRRRRAAPPRFPVRCFSPSARTRHGHARRRLSLLVVPWPTAKQKTLGRNPRVCSAAPVQVRPRQVRHQPGLAEEYGTHDEAPSKLCTRTLPNAWRTPLPSLARSQWT
eukprot:scaffold38668_cov90-Phaeocystis_antarctica.AAC.3